MNDEMKWWYLSYACHERGFLGAVILAAENFGGACKWSAHMGLSPGGQACGHIILEKDQSKISISQIFRLLNKHEATEIVEMIDNSDVH